MEFLEQNWQDLIREMTEESVIKSVYDAPLIRGAANRASAIYTSKSISEPNKRAAIEIVLEDMSKAKQK